MDENKNKTELNDEQLEQVSVGRYIQDVKDAYQYAYTGIVYSDSNS